MQGNKNVKELTLNEVYMDNKRIIEAGKKKRESKAIRFIKTLDMLFFG